MTKHEDERKAREMHGIKINQIMQIDHLNSLKDMTTLKINHLNHINQKDSDSQMIDNYCKKKKA